MKKTLIALAALLIAGSAAAGSTDFSKIEGMDPAKMDLTTPRMASNAVLTTPTPPRRNLLGPQGDPVPEFMVAAGNQAEGMPLAPLLRSLLKGSGLNPFVAPGLAATPVSKASGVIGGRKLADVLDELSSDMGFYYRVQGSTLYVEPNRRFEESLPPIADFTKTVVEQLKELGATAVVFNQFSNRVTFSATRPAAVVIEDYLRSLDTALVPISFEVVVVEMSARATDSFELRIDKAMSALNPAGQFGMANTQAGVSGALRLSGGWVFQNGMSIAGAVDILSTQGTVSDFKKTIVSTTSGMPGEATFTRVEKYFLVEKGATSSTGQVGSSTATEKQVPIGLKVRIKPTYQNGIVWTDVSIELTDLARYEVVTLDGNQQRVPIPATRSATATALTLRPGELFVLSALTTGRDTVDKSGLPIMGLLPTGHEGAKERNNLVVMLRPIVTLPRSAN